MSTIVHLVHRRRRPEADGLAEDPPIAAETARHARRGIDIATVQGIPGDIHRPAGAPSGACNRCGCQESRKLPRIVTGVYTDYPLCADFTACLERLGAAPALLPLPAPELEAGPEPRGVACDSCGYQSSAETVWGRWKDLQRHAAEHAPAAAEDAEDSPKPLDGEDEGDDQGEAAGPEEEAAAAAEGEATDGQ